MLGYLIGPRVQPRRDPYTPYVKILVGLGYFNYPYEPAQGRYFVIAPGAGVDLMLGQNLEIRLIDIEYQEWPQFTFGTISPYGINRSSEQSGAPKAENTVFSAQTRFREHNLPWVRARRSILGQRMDLMRPRSGSSMISEVE
jgi:hypothetical protein